MVDDARRTSLRWLARRVAKPLKLVRRQTGDAPERTLVALIYSGSSQFDDDVVGRRMYGRELEAIPTAGGSTKGPARGI